MNIRAAIAKAKQLLAEMQRGRRCDACHPSDIRTTAVAEMNVCHACGWPIDSHGRGFGAKRDGELYAVFISTDDATEPIA